MPQYEYRCRKCRRRFSVRRSFMEHDHGQNPKCPKCESRAAERRISRVHVQTSRKS